MAADVGPDHLHGPAGLLHLADAEDDAARRSRSRSSRRPRASIGWDEVAGCDEAKAELQEVVEFLRDPERFTKLGAKVPKGILLHGPPGTGKTLLAKAVAHESGAKFFSQSAAAFVEMFAGLGAARIRRLFARRARTRPAIIFIDEIDAVGGERGSDNNSEREQTLNQLLVEMDGFDSTGDLVVIAASNLLEKLDPALLRPGRFDRQIFVSPPDVAGREEILRVHTRGKPLGATSTSPLIARQTSGLTGADLANICNEAAIFAAREHRDVIVHGDFDAALERVVAGMQSRRTLNEHERRVVAFHEAGHALCAELLPGVDRVHKISIVPRGRALGYTLNLPEEDRYLKTREELIDYMTVLLGGRAAEEIVFGAITTGASDDLAARRRDLALDGPRLRDGHDDHLAQACPPRAARVSDRTRELRDEEQQHLTDEAMRARGEADRSSTARSSTSWPARCSKRGARARRHRPHHGRHPAARAPAARPARGGDRAGRAEAEAGLALGLGLHRAVVDGLDVVAVGVEDEGAVVVLVVVRARARLAVVGPARGERGGVEGATSCSESTRKARWQASAGPRRARSRSPAACAHADHAGRRLQHHAVAERLQRLLVERAAGGRVGREELDVIDHGAALPAHARPRRGCRRARTWRRAIASNSSSASPAPTATQVSGESATRVGIDVSFSSRSASPCSSAPPPASRMPWMRMSEDSSGGVRSSVSRTASTICCTWLGERRADVVGVEHHRAREAREQLAAAHLDLDRLGHRVRRSRP